MESENKDMTLKLADDLLLRILSLLPTKDALRTSLLSKRWRHLWTSFSNISLHDSRSLFCNRSPDCPDCMTYSLLFVDRLLLGHDDSDITTFKVSRNVHVDAVRVHSWISNVIKHNVNEIDLDFPMTDSCLLPSCLFSSQSLITLSISVMNPQGIFSSLSAGCSYLKSLNLSTVQLSNDYSTKKFFSELSSILPMLQQLSIVQCELENMTDLVISSSTLVSITMNIFGRGILDCEVVVIAQKANCFYCQTDGTIGICLASPNIFEDASLEFINPGFGGQVIVYPRLERLLFQMRNSKHLTMSNETVEGLRKFFEHVPVLQKLTHLDSSGSILRSTIEGILEFMQKIPNLEYLSISLDADDGTDDWWNVFPVPGCLMIKLKKLKVSGLCSVRPEMHLIKFFLENAPNLEEVQVYADKWNVENLEIFRNVLVTFPRSSEKCALSFSLGFHHDASKFFREW